MVVRRKQFLVLVALLSAFCMGLFMWTDVAGADEIDAIPEMSATAILTGNDGQAERVALQEVEAMPRLTAEGEERTYVADVYSSRNSNLTLSANDADDSLSVRAYITIAYEKSSNDYVLLKRVSGRWSLLDQSVTVSRAQVAYGCTSLAVGYGQAGHRTVANNFGFYTGFSEMVPISAGTMGANLTLDLKHGTSSAWSFAVDATLMNNKPGMR